MDRTVVDLLNHLGRCCGRIGFNGLGLAPGGIETSRSVRNKVPAEYPDYAGYINSTLLPESCTGDIKLLQLHLIQPLLWIHGYRVIAKVFGHHKKEITGLKISDNTRVTIAALNHLFPCRLPGSVDIDKLRRYDDRHIYFDRAHLAVRAGFPDILLLHPGRRQRIKKTFFCHVRRSLKVHLRVALAAHSYQRLTCIPGKLAIRGYLHGKEISIRIWICAVAIALHRLHDVRVPIRLRPGDNRRVVTGYHQLITHHHIGGHALYAHRHHRPGFLAIAVYTQ